MVIRKPVHVTVGPMCSGKTSALESRLNRLAYEGRAPRIYKPVVDGRYGSQIRSHCGKFARDVARVADLGQVVWALENQFAPLCRAVLVDEFQFFEADGWLDSLRQLASLDAVDEIWLYGLDLDARGRPWATVAETLPFATTVTKLSAVCMKCLAPATMTQRLTPWPGLGTVAPGSTSDYEPRCVGCWHG